MTGKELVDWIKENEAEDMEILLLQDDGVVDRIKPEIVQNMRIKEEYWEAGFLPDVGESVIL
jgi:hypothetical protein